MLHATDEWWDKWNLIGASSVVRAGPIIKPKVNEIYFSLPPSCFPGIPLSTTQTRWKAKDFLAIEFLATGTDCIRCFCPSHQLFQKAKKEISRVPMSVFRLMVDKKGQTPRKVKKKKNPWERHTTSKKALLNVSVWATRCLIIWPYFVQTLGEFASLIVHEGHSSKAYEKWTR